jgi:DNA-binding ferritin-like protein
MTTTTMHREVQAFGQISIENLTQALTNTITLRDLYKKHRWQVSGPTFYQLHLLFDEHYEQQNELVDLLAERIQSLGGVSIAMAADVAEMTIIPRPPRGREEPRDQITRLLHAHEIVLKEARTMARLASEAGDDGRTIYLSRTSSVAVKSRSGSSRNISSRRVTKVSPHHCSRPRGRYELHRLFRLGQILKEGPYAIGTNSNRYGRVARDWCGASRGAFEVGLQHRCHIPQCQSVVGGIVEPDPRRW